MKNMIDSKIDATKMCDKFSVRNDLLYLTMQYKLLNQHHH